MIYCALEILCKIQCFDEKLWQLKSQEQSFETPYIVLKKMKI